MSQQIPPGLATLLSQGPDPDQGQDRNELADLQNVIDAMHSLMVSLKDPNQVHQVATALRLLTGIQQQMMSEQGAPGGASQAPPQ